MTAECLGGITGSHTLKKYGSAGVVLLTPPMLMLHTSKANGRKDSLLNLIMLVFIG